MTKSDRTRQAIVFAAKECFAVHGYSGASVRMVAQRAEVALGLQYRYFEDKLELAKEVLRMCLREILKDLTDLPTQGPELALLNRAVATFQSDQTLWKAWFRLRLEPDLLPTVRELLSESMADLATGDIPFPLPRLLLMIAAIDGIVQQRELLPNYPFDQVAEAFAVAFAETDSRNANQP